VLNDGIFTAFLRSLEWSLSTAVCRNCSLESADWSIQQKGNTEAYRNLSKTRYLGWTINTRIKLQDTFLKFPS